MKFGQKHCLTYRRCLDLILAVESRHEFFNDTELLTLFSLYITRDRQICAVNLSRSAIVGWLREQAIVQQRNAIDW